MGKLKKKWKQKKVSVNVLKQQMIPIISLPLQNYRKHQHLMSAMSLGHFFASVTFLQEHPKAIPKFLLKLTTHTKHFTFSVLVEVRKMFLNIL